MALPGREYAKRLPRLGRFAAVIRCLRANRTRQTDSHQHTMQVRRGPDGQGVNSVQCSTCHQDHNLAGAHMPPGAPDWHLPPPETPMIWEGLTDGQLCELLKDPKQNGHRSLQQIVEHMSTPLVLWGWNPGEGRSAVPMKLSEFQARVRDWDAKGAACPAGTGAKGGRGGWT